MNMHKCLRVICWCFEQQTQDFKEKENHQTKSFKVEEPVELSQEQGKGPQEILFNSLPKLENSADHITHSPMFGVRQATFTAEQIPHFGQIETGKHKEKHKGHSKHKEHSKHKGHSNHKKDKTKKAKQ